MSILVIGLNHRSSPATLLERVAVSSDDQAKVLETLTSLDHVLEIAILSTCNRVEIYAHVSRFHPALEELLAWFAARGGVDVDTIAANAYTHFDDQVAAHIFSVAAGLDSVIIGERQIALQVKQAANVARDEGSSRRVLQRLFNQALNVSRRVRLETEISQGASSMVDVGLDTAAEELGGSLSGRSVLIIGAGKIGGLTGQRLNDDGVGSILVRNRSRERGERLAARVGGTVISTGDLRSALGQVDLAVCCAGASMPIIDADLLAAVAGDRDRATPLVLLDLAMPRNVDPACASFSGVRLVDLEEVRAAADSTAASGVVEEAREIVEEEAARFRAWTRAVKIDPTIRALRERAEQVRQAELDRLGGRLSDLDDRQREVLEALTRGIVNTLLHEPTVRLKDLADTGGAEIHVNALRDLFDLDE